MNFLKLCFIPFFAFSVVACGGGGGGGSGVGVENNKNFTVSVESISVSRLGEDIAVSANDLESDSKTYIP